MPLPIETGVVSMTDIDIGPAQGIGIAILVIAGVAVCGLRVAEWIEERRRPLNPCAIKGYVNA
jgi:hypothetical protein